MAIAECWSEVLTKKDRINKKIKTIIWNASYISEKAWWEITPPYIWLSNGWHYVYKKENVILRWESKASKMANILVKYDGDRYYVPIAQTGSYTPGPYSYQHKIKDFRKILKEWIKNSRELWIFQEMSLESMLGSSIMLRHSMEYPSWTRIQYVAKKSNWGILYNAYLNRAISANTTFLFKV